MPLKPAISGNFREVPHFIDEPTSGLDFSHMMQTAKLLKQLKSKNAYIFVFTHDYELIMSACDEVIEIENGILRSNYLLDHIGLKKLKEFLHDNYRQYELNHSKSYCNDLPRTGKGKTAPHGTTHGDRRR